MVLTIGSGAILAAAALYLRPGTGNQGTWPAVLLLGFALLSAVSIIWSVQPDASWRDASRLLAYAAVFGAATALVRIDRRRWPALLGGLVLASVAICAYALLAKSLPDRFEEANRYARLYEPFGYWNALGLTAAMGVLGCMWLGARRSGHALLSALAYPAMGLLLLTLLLAYSRGALAALVVGVIAVVRARAVAVARRRGARLRCARGGRDRGVGLLQPRPELGKRAGRRSHLRRSRARRAGHRDGRAAHARRRRRSCSRRDGGRPAASCDAAPARCCSRRSRSRSSPSRGRSRRAIAASPARSPTPSTRSRTRTRRCRTRPAG